MKLISKEKLRATKDNLLKNDCPLQCDKKHCDVCQFRSNPTLVPTIETVSPLPEAYGRDMYI